MISKRYQNDNQLFYIRHESPPVQYVRKIFYNTHVIENYCTHTHKKNCLFLKSCKKTMITILYLFLNPHLKKERVGKKLIDLL